LQALTGSLSYRPQQWHIRMSKRRQIWFPADIWTTTQ